MRQNREWKKWRKSKKKIERKGRGWEGMGEETKPAAFIFSLYFPRLPSQSWWAQLPVCLWTPILQLKLAIGWLRYQKEKVAQIHAKRPEGTSSCKPMGTYPWIPTSLRWSRKALYCMASQRQRFLMLGLTRKGQRLPTVHCLFGFTC